MPTLKFEVTWSKAPCTCIDDKSQVLDSYQSDEDKVENTWSNAPCIDDDKSQVLDSYGADGYNGEDT